MRQNGKIIKALKTAFLYTIPILTGFGFLGMAYGIYMNVSGFPFTYPMIMSIVVFGGSMQFVAVSMLLAPFDPIQTFFTAVLVQARHLFYGIAMLDKYKGMGWKRFYLIFGMCDETFSINYTADIPEDVDKGWFMFFVTLLDQFYWLAASTIGGLVGSMLTFSTEGLDFVMTSMFVVIFLNQWMKEKKHYTGLIGLFSTLICRVIFGAESFMIPAMICILMILWIFQKPIEEAGGLE